MRRPRSEADAWQKKVSVTQVLLTPMSAAAMAGAAGALDCLLLELKEHGCHGTNTKTCKHALFLCASMY